MNMETSTGHFIPSGEEVRGFLEPKEAATRHAAPDSPMVSGMQNQVASRSLLTCPLRKIYMAYTLVAGPALNTKDPDPANSTLERSYLSLMELKQDGPIIY
jgi:hypothetical protein